MANHTGAHQTDSANTPPVALPPVAAMGIPASPLRIADRAEEYQTRLASELEPQGQLQSILVAELARHASGMDLGLKAEAASLQFAARNASAVQICAGLDGRSAELVAAMTSEQVAQATRYRTGHERAFYAALRGLSQAARLSRSSGALELFRTEDECMQYLYDWQQRQPWLCPSCGSDKRFWLRSRAKFECSRGHQHSVRANTLFAASHVPLLAWFRIVLAILLEPQLPIDELARRVCIVRQATVRALAQQVAVAIDSPPANELLAGLPLVAASHLRQPSRRVAVLVADGQCARRRLSIDKSQGRTRRRRPK